MSQNQDYVRTDLKGFLSVGSIASVWTIETGGQIAAGESHDFPELVYVRRGPYSVKIDGEPLVLRPGQLMIYAPNSYHQGHLPCDATLCIVGFEAQLPLTAPIYNTPIMLSEKQRDAMEEIISLGSGLFRPAPSGLGLRGMIPCEGVADYGFQQLKNRLELFLIDIYSSFSQSSKPSLGANRENFRNEQLSRVQDYMLENLSRELSLSLIASECSMSVPQLKLLFRETCGCGPIAWFIDQKLAAAKAMIRETSLSFTQISERLGFGSVHYFSRQFKAKTGMTPSEYARKVGK